jgi:hypothetical protein
MIKSRKMIWVGHVACMREMRCIQNSGQKPEGKKPLGRPRCRREDDIRMDLSEIGLEVVGWTHLAQNRTE